MNTHEYYVSLETAKMLEEAGFDWDCCYCYDAETKDFLDDNEGEFNFNEGDDNDFYSAPTLEVAQRWLREVKGIHICVKPNEASANCKYFVMVIVSDTKWGNIQDDNRKTIMFDTYEEAQEAGEKKALEKILEKGDKKSPEPSGQ